MRGPAACGHSHHKTLLVWLWDTRRLPTLSPALLPMGSVPPGLSHLCLFILTCPGSRSSNPGSGNGGHQTQNKRSPEITPFAAGLKPSDTSLSDVHQQAAWVPGANVALFCRHPDTGAGQGGKWPPLRMSPAQNRGSGWHKPDEIMGQGDQRLTVRQCMNG